jgi:hypothetical protein
MGDVGPCSHAMNDVIVSWATWGPAHILWMTSSYHGRRGALLTYYEWRHRIMGDVGHMTFCYVQCVLPPAGEKKHLCNSAKYYIGGFYGDQQITSEDVSLSSWWVVIRWQTLYRYLPGVRGTYYIDFPLDYFVNIPVLMQSVQGRVAIHTHGMNLSHDVLA